GVVDAVDHLRADEDQILVAALQRQAAVILGGEVGGVDLRPHRPIEEEDALLQFLQVAAVGPRAGVSGGVERGGHWSAPSLPLDGPLPPAPPRRGEGCLVRDLLPRRPAAAPLASHPLPAPGRGPGGEVIPWQQKTSPS